MAAEKGGLGVSLLLAIALKRYVVLSDVSGIGLLGMEQQFRGGIGFTGHRLIEYLREFPILKGGDRQLVYFIRLFCLEPLDQLLVDAFHGACRTYGCTHGITLSLLSICDDVPCSRDIRIDMLL